MEVNDLTAADLVQLQRWGLRRAYMRPGRLWYNIKRAGFRAGFLNGIAFLKSTMHMGIGQTIKSRKRNRTILLQTIPHYKFSMKSVSIIIPALDERPNLELLIPRISSACGHANIEWEVIVVDSNSKDGTADFIAGFADTLPVRLLNEPVRGDLARAWRRGIEAAKHSRIITMDADLCHAPEFIPELFSALDSADVVIASRYLSRERRKWTKSLHQELASRLGQRFCRWALRLPVTDISHGFRAFRKELYERLKNDITTPGNTFLIAFIYHAHLTGARIREIPYVYGKRIHGKDHLKVSRESMRFFAFTLSIWRKS